MFITSLIPLLILFAVILLPVLWFVGTFNGLVRLRNTTDESWSDVDTELKRRHDLIPNLVETVKGYAAHERDTLGRVVEARNRAMAPAGSPVAASREENALTGTLRQLFAVAEAYPQLRANENFLRLQSELANTEDRIQAARRFYNANVRDLNSRIQMFPSNIVAGMFGFQQKDFFEIENPADRAVPEVKF